MKDDAEAANWRELKIDGFMELIGPLLRSRNNEGPKLYGFQTNEKHKNAIGLIHGGVVTSLLDQVIALEAWNAADRKPIVTVQMDTRFLNAARAGSFLKAIAEIRHTTRSLMFVDAEVFCGETKIATATAIMKITHKAG